MLTTDLKAKEELYEVVEPRYFENAQSLSSEDEQGSIYDLLAQKNTQSGYQSTRTTTILKSFS